MSDNEELKEDVDRCWCGVVNPHFEELPARCGGAGVLYCECGGDNLCFCHNHGEIQCDGCPDCEDDDDYDDDLDDWGDDVDEERYE